MPERGMALRRMGFLTIGRFDHADPGPGHEETQPQGPRGMIASPDYVGTSEEIADALYAHRGFQRVDEVAFALPHGFDERDHVQIITDMAEKLGPKLGWIPAHAHVEPPPDARCGHIRDDQERTVVAK